MAAGAGLPSLLYNHVTVLSSWGCLIRACWPHAPFLLLSFAGPSGLLEFLAHRSLLALKPADLL